MECSWIADNCCANFCDVDDTVIMDGSQACPLVLEHSLWDSLIKWKMAFILILPVRLGAVAHACKTSALEAEASRSPEVRGLRPA